MFTHLNNAELARKLNDYTVTGTQTAVVPAALLEEVAIRLQNDPSFRPSR